LAHERGEDMAGAIERAKRLSERIQAMNSAGPLVRLYVVARTFDPEIARSTLDNYEPAEPLSLGALTAGALGALGDGPRRAPSHGHSAAAPAFARAWVNRKRRASDRLARVLGPARLDFT
jgi:hypothetical protein